MSSSRAGATRPSSRQIKKLWITGSVALGVVAISSGAAMASMATQGEGDGAEPTPSGSGTPGTETCLHLDQEALAKIHEAEKQSNGGTADVRLPSDVVTTCPDSTAPPTDPGSGNPAEPGDGTPTDPGSGNPAEPGDGTPTDPGSGNPAEPTTPADTSPAS
jgi:hypothetical protein